MKKTTKKIVGSAVTLGVGGAVLQGLYPSMPAGTGAPLISNTIGKGASMMGAVTSAAYGAEVMKMVAKKSRRRRR